jgi:hypothetical protein
MRLQRDIRWRRYHIIIKNKKAIAYLEIITLIRRRKAMMSTIIATGKDVVVSSYVSADI